MIHARVPKKIVKNNSIDIIAVENREWTKQNRKSLVFIAQDSSCTVEGFTHSTP